MTLDSNIIIAYLAGDELVITTLSNWREEGRSLFVPAVVESEVLSFAKWTNEERKNAELFLEENFAFLPFDRATARIAADLRRDAKIKLPDAAIAASALITQTPLVTRNVKDFSKIAGLTTVHI